MVRLRATIVAFMHSVLFTTGLGYTRRVHMTKNYHHPKSVSPQFQVAQSLRFKPIMSESFRGLHSSVLQVRFFGTRKWPNRIPFDVSPVIRRENGS